MALSYRLVETSAGAIGIVASRKGLMRVFLPVGSAAEQIRRVESEFPDAREDAALLPDLSSDLRRFFAGERVRFKAPFDWSRATSFDAEVWRECSRIRYGCVESYGSLATRLGRPKAARAIGNAMRRNPCPIVVPCHRVVRSDGSIGGYSGELGVSFKKRLLEMEQGDRA